MNDSFLVSSFERLGNLYSDLQRFLNGERASLHSLGERLAGNQLHHEASHTVALLQTVDRGNVRMIQRCEHPRFALKTGQPFRIIYEVCRKDFDRYVAPERSVVRLIHLAHSSRADLRENFVRSETCAGSERHHFFPTGTFCFNSSNQFSTTLICVGAACACSLGLSIRKRWPSGDTS